MAVAEGQPERGDAAHRRGGRPPGDERLPRRPERRGPFLRRPLSGAPPGLVHGGAEPREPVPPPHPRRSSPRKGFPRTSPTWRWWRAPSGPRLSPARGRRGCGSSSRRPGRRYGLQQDWWVDERSDPDKATRAAARYLKELYGMFSDWNLAMAAYNSGEATVAKGHRALRHQRFLAAVADPRLPARDQELRPPDPRRDRRGEGARRSTASRSRRSRRPSPRRSRCRAPWTSGSSPSASGGSVDQVRTLNPELRRLSTPPGARFDVKVPAGTERSPHPLPGDRCPQEKRVQFRTHVVGAGADPLHHRAPLRGAVPGHRLGQRALARASRWRWGPS